MNDHHPLFAEFEEQHAATTYDSRKKNSRRGGPASSDRAFSAYAKAGKLGSDRRRAFDQVRARPGLTSKELAGDDYRWLIALRKRLSDLERDGLIRSIQIGNEDKRWYPR